MTNSTIDPASITFNLSNASDSEGPASTAISAGKPPFEKSLEQAMQIISAQDEVMRSDPEQLLPQVRQELPLESPFSAGLEGVSEVRALADAISRIARSTGEALDPISNEIDLSASSAVSADFTRVSDGAEDGGALLSLFDAGVATPKPISVATDILKSRQGGDFSDSEMVSLDLLRDSGKPPGNLNVDINFKDRYFKDPISSESHELRTIVSAAGSLPEAPSNKDNISRSGSLEPSVGLSPIAQPETKPINRSSLTPTLQQAPMTKSSDIVSSNELATHLRVLKSSGGGEARLQLHPSELGRMTVNLITEGDEARVSFVVDNSQAKHAVEMSLPRLRDLMDGAGLSLLDADVSERQSKKDEEKPPGRLTEETVSSSGSDSESFEEATSANTSQLVDAFA